MFVSLICNKNTTNCSSFLVFAPNQPTHHAVKLQKPDLSWFPHLPGIFYVQIVFLLIVIDRKETVTAQQVE